MSFFESTIVHTLPLLPKGLVRRFSSRYIAGESMEDALQVVQKLNQRSILGTVDLLGEDILEPAEAATNRQAYGDLLTALNEHRLDGNISVKLTAMGLKISRDLCLEQIAALLEHARRLDNFVRIDMEDSTCTTPTLEIYRELRNSFDNVGVVIQAYMRRSHDDVRELAAMKANVRLCKGIYIENRTIAYRDREIVQRNYADLLAHLLNAGCYVGIATHDELLVWEGLRLVRDLQLDRTQYEFQMLLGVDEMLRDILVDAGHRLRVYIPFGDRWYEYSMRRLKENPRIAVYILKNLLAGLRGAGRPEVEPPGLDLRRSREP
ncbi:MAG: proline dehydrogenase [Acidobacteria bacterium]|nr:MAG: proline dehydrogenase [Acidobacteriota bacterium]